MERPWGVMHVRSDGPTRAPVMLMANSLGTDLRMWDAVVAILPEFRILRFDKRGHGLSATPVTNWTIEELADDAMAILDHFGTAHATVVGCSIGGMIAQALAIRHPHRVNGLVLSNTAAKIGTAETWQARIDAVVTDGIESIAGQILGRWFAPAFLQKPEAQIWRHMLLRNDRHGYAKTCKALAGADFTEGLAQVKVPTAFIAGTEDQATAPDLVQASAQRVPDSSYHLLQGSGHIPAIDAPGKVAKIITDMVSQVTS